MYWYRCSGSLYHLTGCSVISSPVSQSHGAHTARAPCSLLSVSLLPEARLSHMLIYCRSHDIDARLGSIPYGPFLRQLWYHGHLQLPGHRSAGKGGGVIEEHRSGILKYFGWDTWEVNTCTYNSTHQKSRQTPVRIYEQSLFTCIEACSQSEHA